MTSETSALPRAAASPGLAGRSTGDVKRRRRVVKAAVFAAAVFPLAKLVWQALTDSLGANPIAEGLNRLGYWALVCLLASLACTPMQRLTRWSWPLAVRRMLGLFAFTYAALHVSVYLGLDQLLAFGEIWKDIVKRPFITVGTLAFLILLPLALTSTNKMVKRLGFARWKRLHRGAYLAAVAGVVHFYWRVKADHREPWVFILVLATLMALRLGRGRRQSGLREAAAGPSQLAASTSSPPAPVRSSSAS